MKLLLTAFDPFGEDRINPALESVKNVTDKIGSIEITKLEVPTVFRKSIDVVKAEMNRLQPDVVLCIGQAGGRFDVTPERVAINIDDARIPDNEGKQPLSSAIFEDGETAYFSSLPIKAIEQAIRDIGLPSSVSNTAGTFVCNHLMYGVLYYINKEYPHMRGGFIHVPYIPEQVANQASSVPYMSLPDITRALEAAIEAIGMHHYDITTAEGKIQ